MSDTAAAVLSGSYQLHVRASSWLSGRLLAADVPIDTGVEEGDRSNGIPHRVSLTVPRYDKGVDWSPTTAGHPLRADGQRLTIDVGVGLPGGVVEWCRRGEFVIHETESDGDSVTVECRSLLQLVAEARLVSPYQPTGTFLSTVRGLVEPAISVVKHITLTDRAVPTGRLNFDEDRLSALSEVLEAWPAEALVTPAGYLLLRPVTTPAAADVDITDLMIGQPTGTSTRDGAANVIVARGTAPDGGQLQGVAYDVSPESSRRYGGPFSPLAVPEYLFSPLLTTVAQCRAAAQTRLTRRLRAQLLPFDVACPPRPDLELGDALPLPDGTLVTIEAYALPYTPERSMALTVAAVPS